MKRLYNVAVSLIIALAMVVGTCVLALAAGSSSKMSGSAAGIEVVKVDGQWVAVRSESGAKGDAVIATDYTGIAKNQYGWWRVSDGYVDFDFTGVAQNEYGWWRVEDGKVDFTANGIYKNEFGWWKTSNGKVNFSAKGVYKNEYGWWYVNKGKVDFGFTGIAGNSYGYWHIKNGKVDFSKNGTLQYNGTTWTITNGKAVGQIPARVKTAFANAGANNVSYRNSYDYCIAVNTKRNIVIIYGKDANGQYSKPVKSMVCSCGKSSTPTKTGTFKTTDKYTWRALNGGVYGQYATRITGSYLFHSVPYYKQDKSTLETAEYNKLGSPASAGCVRLAVKDAKWIYDHCPKGTIVTIYADNSLQEPLIKPAAVKLNANDWRSGWDPTDPDGRNPWK